MGLLRPHRVVAPAARAPTDARGDHARPPPRILRLFSAAAKCQIRRFYLGLAGAKAAETETIADLKRQIADLQAKLDKIAAE